jgi:very-short-patch-repair endonuclease
MPKLFNHANTRSFRKQLRREMTAAEKKLWYHLRGRALEGFKFRRQHAIGPYIGDFYCPLKRLVIEVDGDSHGNPEAAVRDANRDAFMAREGIRVIRFTDTDVQSNIEAVIERIMAVLIDPS